MSVRTFLGILGRRLLPTLVALFGVLILVFAMVRLVPGDPVRSMLGQRASPQEIAKVRAELGLDQPLLQQFVRYLGRTLQGDLGTSLRHHVPVTRELGRALPATLELTFCAFLVAVPLGILLGGVAASRKDTIFDTGITSLSLAGLSVPIFWLGLLGIMLFSVGWEVLPFGGRSDLGLPRRTGFMLLDGPLEGGLSGLWDAVRHLILPALTLATVPTAMIARMTRTCLVDTLRSDFVRTARAKGLSESRIFFRHALPPALLSIITIIGLQFGYLLGGAVLTEHVFSWPGLGSLLLQAIGERDYPVIQGAVLLSATIFCLLNLGVDLLYRVLDPRVRLAEEEGQ